MCEVIESGIGPAIEYIYKRRQTMANFFETDAGKMILQFLFQLFFDWLRKSSEEGAVETSHKAGACAKAFMESYTA